MGRRVIPPEAGAVIKVRGLMQEYNGRPQFRIDKLRAMSAEDNVDMSKLIACAPYPPQDMLDTIRVLAIKDDSIRNIVLERLDEVNDRLLYFPAAQRIHHAERAGLLHHTLTMLRCADALIPIYPFPWTAIKPAGAGVILHDLSKTEELKSDNMGLVSEYTRGGQLIGRFVQGAMAIDRIARSINAPDETREMLEHMLLSHHELPEYGSPKPRCPRKPKSYSMIDRLDARMYEMSHTISCVEPGAFTDKV